MSKSIHDLVMEAYLECLEGNKKDPYLLAIEKIEAAVIEPCQIRSEDPPSNEWFNFPWPEGTSEQQKRAHLKVLYPFGMFVNPPGGNENSSYSPSFP